MLGRRAAGVALRKVEVDLAEKLRVTSGSSEAALATALASVALLGVLERVACVLEGLHVSCDRGTAAVDDFGFAPERRNGDCDCDIAGD